MESVFRVDPDTAYRVAERYGTPLYVLSEDCFRDTIRRYKAAFQAAAQSGKTELSYASKANGTLALLHIAHEEGCLIDVASEGELRGALIAGVPATACEFHGNNKADEEIQFALTKGVRTIAVDNFYELQRLAAIWPKGAATHVVLRLAPGVDPITHQRIATGQEDSKFGFNISDGSAEHALCSALEAGLPVVGFHCHVGSQLLDPGAQIAGGEALARFAMTAKDKHGFEAQVINLGGGLGIRYTERDHPLPVEEYCERLVQAVMAILIPAGLSPTLMQEPGRALIGECGVTLYRVGAIKTVPTASGPRTYVTVDGGLGDNPRPALYGAEYTVEALRGISQKHIGGLGQDPSASLGMTSGAGAAPMKVTVSGRHCETDELFSNVTLPGDLAPGDLLQVLCTGAYNSSMANNYNRYPRPAAVLIRGNEDKLVQRRETWDELFARETGF